MVIRTLILTLVFLAHAIAAEIPRAKPAEVGLAQDRLDRITRALQHSVEQGHIAGAIGVVARKGKIA